MSPPPGSVVSQFPPSSVLKTAILDMASFGDVYKSPGHFALFEAIRFKRHRQALLLLEAGVDVNCKNGNGLTPIIYAVLYVDEDKSRVKLVRLLLDCDANPNITDWNGRTALMHASCRGDVDVVKVLLENKSTNINMKDPDGYTALMHAASNGHVDVISAFLTTFRHDLNLLKLNHRNNLGQTAVQISAQNNHDECTRLLTREAQLFPNAINEFPDPKILEREPTPIDANINNTSAKKLFSLDKLIHIGEFLTEIPMHKSVGTNTWNLLPQALDDGNDSTDKEIIKQNADEIEMNCSCEFTCHTLQNKVIKEVCNKSTQTVMCKPPIQRTRPKTTKITKILEPIQNNLDHTRLYSTAPESKISFQGTLGRSTDYLVTVVRQNAWESCAKNRRPDSEPSILPLIPCTSPLPPVRKSLTSSRKYNTSRLFTADRHSRDNRAFKSNIVCNTS